MNLSQDIDNFSYIRITYKPNGGTGNNSVEFTPGQIKNNVMLNLLNVFDEAGNFSFDALQSRLDYVSDTSLRLSTTGTAHKRIRVGHSATMDEGYDLFAATEHNGETNKTILQGNDGVSYLSISIIRIVGIKTQTVKVLVP